jgi:hypothetical protein
VDTKVEIKSGQIVSGPQFSELMRVETVPTNGAIAWVMGLVGVQSERFENETLTRTDVESSTIFETNCRLDGDGKPTRSGLLYEFDSVSRLSSARLLRRAFEEWPKKVTAMIRCENVNGKLSGRHGLLTAALP